MECKQEHMPDEMRKRFAALELQYHDLVVRFNRSHWLLEAINAKVNRILKDLTGETE